MDITIPTAVVETAPPPSPPAPPRPNGTVLADGTLAKREIPFLGSYVIRAQALENFGSTREAMMSRGLDWQVEKSPIFDSRGIEIETHRATRRADTHEVLGVVGKGYVPVQNRTLAEFTDTLVDTHESSLAGMGTSQGSKRVFTAVRLDRDLTPPGMPEEAQDAFLMVTNGHDGGLAFTASILIYRLVCSNGLMSLVPGMTSRVYIKHTTNVDRRIAAAHKLLTKSHTYLDRYQEITAELMARQLDDTERTFLADRLLPVPANEDTTSRKRNAAKQRHSSFVRVWRTSENLENIRWSGWGFVNAAAEWDQWSHNTNARRRRSHLDRLIEDDKAFDVVGRAGQLVRAL